MEKSNFNFNKSNNYQKLAKKPVYIPKYTSSSIYDSKDDIKKQNDTVSNHFLNTTNKSSFSLFNKGLINIISKAMEQKSDDKPFTLKKQDDVNQIRE